LSPKGTVIKDIIDNTDDYIHQQHDKLSVSEFNLVAPRLSTAIAFESRRTPYDVIPDDVGILEVEPNKPPSVWVAFEFPTLTNSAEIDQIVRVSWDTMKLGDITWKKGDKPLQQNNV